jgi:hypothetical protein
MSRHTLTTSRVGRIALVLTGTLVLAGCTNVPAALSAVGVPSLSLNAPLTTVACASSGACIALGASGGANAPTTAAQIRNHKGVWSALNVPAAPLASFYSGSCAMTTCYFGGAKSSGELLWSINTDNGHVASLKGPPGGLVIRDLSCVSDANCTVIDVAANNLIRVSHTTDAGATWSAPRTLRWALGGGTALACVAVTDCYIASTSSTHVVTLRHTLDGGAVFAAVATPATWRSLTSLMCVTQCTALLTTASGSAIATQGKSNIWHQTPLTFNAAALSCASTTLCLAVGQTGVQTPTMAQWSAHGAHIVSLTYVPSALTDVACQPQVCVAIGVTTVVSLRP